MREENADDTAVAHPAHRRPDGAELDVGAAGRSDHLAGASSEGDVGDHHERGALAHQDGRARRHRSVGQEGAHAVRARASRACQARRGLGRAFTDAVDMKKKKTE